MCSELSIVLQQVSAVIDIYVSKNNQNFYFPKEEIYENMLYKL